jgi:predicted Zn-dependent peptidase
MTLCALGDFAANPIIYTIKNFPDDFNGHVQPKADPDAKKQKPAAKGRAARPEKAAGD